MKPFRQAPPLKADETYPKDWPQKYISDSCTRFGARFRIAKAFRSVTFTSGIEKSTAATYSALIRFSVVYSAFEGFISNFHGHKGKELYALEKRYPPVEVLRIIDEERKPGRPLLRKILEFVDSRTRPKAEAIVSGEERSAFAIAAVVRHAYVHGHLTASVARSGPAGTKVLADALSEYLLMIMEETSGSLAKEKQGRMTRMADRLRQVSRADCTPDSTKAAELRQ